MIMIIKGTQGNQECTSQEATVASAMAGTNPDEPAMPASPEMTKVEEDKGIAKLMEGGDKEVVSESGGSAKDEEATEANREEEEVGKEKKRGRPRRRVTARRTMGKRRIIGSGMSDLGSEEEDQGDV